jgi:signal transduction histidine kinase
MPRGHGVATIERVKRLLAAREAPLLLAVVLAWLGLAEAPLHTGREDLGSLMLLTLFTALPVALVRRRLAWAAGLVTFFVLLTLWSQIGLTVSAVIAQLLVAYLAAVRYRRWVLVLMDVPFLLTAISMQNTGIVFALALIVAVQALGVARSDRGQAIAERDAAVEDQIALAERARIARELHDVVAHQMSMVAVQAETARLTTPGMPPEGQERLAEIGDTAREALTEMRRLLGVLRSDAGAELAPQPGLDRVHDLVAAARAGGSAVRLTMSGMPPALPPGVDLTAYRIVQEALSNARRHAPGAAVEITLGYAAGRLRIRVRDHGPGPSGSGDGHGLQGMRERVAMVGGSLHTGAAAGGGFIVEADLPAPAHTERGGLAPGATKLSETSAQREASP